MSKRFRRIRRSMGKQGIIDAWAEGKGIGQHLADYRTALERER